MALRAIIAFLILPMLLSCRTLSNKINELSLDCGAEVLSSDNFLYFSVDEMKGLKKQDLMLFEHDSNSVRPLNFELTSRSCVKIPRKESGDFFDLSVIFRNQTASRFKLSNDFSFSRIVRTSDCFSYCPIFPACGHFEEQDAFSSSRKIFKLNTTSLRGLDAIIDDGSKSRSIKINGNSCISIPKFSTGKLTVRNDEGSFIEVDVKSIIQTSIADEVANLTLREPLNIEEQKCREMSKSHYLVNGKCQAKSFQQYCEDEPHSLGIVIFSSYFLNASCSEIDSVLKRKTSFALFQGTCRLTSIS